MLDRFIQNLRRVLGYEAQYFGGVEPQQRLAPHIHLAVGGRVPRPLLRQVLAATYHQVWWPATEEVRFAGDELPVWDENSGNYVGLATGEVLPTWDDALDAIGPADQPRHVARFGPRFDAQGVLVESGVPSTVTYTVKACDNGTLGSMDTFDVIIPSHGFEESGTVTGDIVKQ